jgi:DNA end-binding protein Ku
MVSIPVRLYKAARRERIRFHHVYRPAETETEPGPTAETDEEPEPEPIPMKPAASAAMAREPEPQPEPPAEPVARVRNLQVADTSQKPVQPQQVLKGYEVEKDRYVTFEPQEIAALRPRTSTELTITEFVHLGEIDPIYFETSYYAVPDKGGEKAYALLFRALAETNYAAVGSLAMHGREHATVIRHGRHGLIVHTLFNQNEVRAQEEHHIDPALVTPKELDLAKLFVNTLAAEFDPSKLKDTLEERLRGLIDEKAKLAVAPTTHAEEPQRAPVVDILEALRKSLELARKPAKRETATPEKPRSGQRRARS